MQRVDALISTQKDTSQKCVGFFARCGGCVLYCLGFGLACECGYAKGQPSRLMIVLIYFFCNCKAVVNTINLMPFFRGAYEMIVRCSYGWSLCFHIEDPYYSNQYCMYMCIKACHDLTSGNNIKQNVSKFSPTQN